jgi:LCP family protein required for cell wall assembly
MSRRLSAIGLFAVIAVGGSAAVIAATNDEVSKTQVDEEVAGALSEVSPGAEVENYLLVGSDSREGADPNDPDYGSIGDEETTTGHRSDVIILVRHDLRTDSASLLSFPRDLLVRISPGGEKDRINSAFATGPKGLVDTISKNFGIEINHYVEVNFNGFKEIVDAIGGVPACFEYPTRDKNTGLRVPEPGCYTLNGVQARQYVRSRHFQQYIDGKWQEDPRSDLGRIDRQQKFILDAVSKAQGYLGEDLLHLNAVLPAARQALTVDPGLDILSLAKRFRSLTKDDIVSYSLPVKGKTVGGKAVLALEEEQAQPILDYFRGDGPAPAVPTTTTPST